MSTAEKGTQPRTMPFALRPLEERDILQSEEIERDAFPTLFPPTSFRRELKNSMAAYLVAWRRDDVLQPAPRAGDSGHGYSNRPLLNRLIHNARSMLPVRQATLDNEQQFLAGFVGIWYMVDEAHVVSIGVRREYRGQGIGELLLIGGIEHALARRARVVTLEVRVSNYIARNLYIKYGFKEQGVRKSYYTDNREDALIMTTDPIQTSEYMDRFHGLVEAHERRWGRADRVLF